MEMFDSSFDSFLSFDSSFDQLHLKLRFNSSFDSTSSQASIHFHDINTVDHAEDEFMVIACDGIWLIFFQVLGFCLLGLLSHFSLRHLLLSLMLGPFIDS
ncbi:hypothetical protein P8452_48074 [Trifolium repens]|nr:hypothetical protein P8452_48074 [Trifolium repens]